MKQKLQDRFLSLVVDELVYVLVERRRRGSITMNSFVLLVNV